VAEAQKDLYSFDKITRVSAPKGGSGTSGGGRGRGGSGGSGGDGEWVRIPGLLDELAQKAKTVLSQIWQPFQDAWKKQGEQTIQSAVDALASVGQAAAAVGQSWMKAWTGGAGERAVSTVLVIIQKLNQSVKAIADNFRTAWEAGGAGDRIMSSILAIVQSVLDGLKNMASATAIWAKQLNFTGLVKGFADLLAALQPVVNLIMNGLNWCYTNVLLPLAGWVIQSAGPAGLNLLSGALQLLTSALTAVQPVAQFVWENLLKPMGQWTGTVLVNGLNAAAGGFRSLSGVLAGLPETWNALKQKAGTIWSGIKNSMTNSANASKKNVTSAFGGMYSGAVDKCNKMKQKLNSIFATIASNARSRLRNISSHLTAPFRNGLNGVIGLVNRVIGKINSAMQFSWPAVKVAGKTLVSAGSVTLARMSGISYLAQGGITTGPTLSMIGEAGREAVLPLERNTGWMDTLAQRISALSNRGETVIEVNIGGEHIVRQVVQGVNDVTRRTGRCPIYL
jgi:hypothetical protein